MGQVAPKKINKMIIITQHTLNSLQFIFDSFKWGHSEFLFGLFITHTKISTFFRVLLSILSKTIPQTYFQPHSGKTRNPVCDQYIHDWKFVVSVQGVMKLNLQLSITLWWQHHCNITITVWSIKHIANAKLLLLDIMIYSVEISGGWNIHTRTHTYIIIPTASNTNIKMHVISKGAYTVGIVMYIYYAIICTHVLYVHHFLWIYFTWDLSFD